MSVVTNNFCSNGGNGTVGCGSVVVMDLSSAASVGDYFCNGGCSSIASLYFPSASEIGEGFCESGCSLVLLI